MRREIFTATPPCPVVNHRNDVTPAKAGVQGRQRHWIPASAGMTAFLILTGFLFAANPPRGFFLEDTRYTPPVPAFYNLDSRKLEPLTFKKPYADFLDVSWDRPRGRVIFSARTSRQEPFRVFMKQWPDGEETVIYENPTGPFRFLISPDGERLVLQVMGPNSWPILGVYEWQTQKWAALGQGYSPDWSLDGKSLLYLKIPGALPTRLFEYSVELGTATQLIDEPVMEAVYAENPRHIVLKTAEQAKRCDVYQIWDRKINHFQTFCLEDPALCKKKKVAQRELAVFPGRRFFFFKEGVRGQDEEHPSLIVSDPWGGRLQTISYDVWNPLASAVEDMSLAMSEEPLIVLPADGAGGKLEIPQARFIRLQH